MDFLVKKRESKTAEMGVGASPEGLDFGTFFAALSSDLVHLLSCRSHHLLHSLLLQLFLLSLR